MQMSLLLRINRDFPYQVALSFDEIAMEVLAWLDDRSFEWDSPLFRHHTYQNEITIFGFGLTAKDFFMGCSRRPCCTE
jgi:hypothetical protein